MTVNVFNLMTGKYEFTYVGITPRQAVMAAYGRYFKRDGNTWDYESRYGHLVRRGACSVSCGDYAAILPKTEWGKKK